MKKLITAMVLLLSPLCGADEEATKSAKTHLEQLFKVKKGDVLLKVSPPKGDFLLLHLRQIDGSWRIVSEYLD